MAATPRRAAAPIVLVLAALLAAALSAPAPAAVLRVPADHARITDALTAAQSTDTVEVAAGVYSAAANGEAFPLVIVDEGLLLRGAGAEACTLDAAGQATVVHVAALAARVTGFTIANGRAPRGGGIYISNGGPEVDHNRLLDNAASLAGAAVYVATGAAPHIHHNVVWGSRDTDPSGGGDPHGIQLDSAHGLIEHNLVGRGDSNGLIVTGTGAPTVRNNIFFANGTPGVRGRGICALGAPETVVAYNLFFDNAVAAIVVILEGMALDVSAVDGNAIDPADGIFENLDGDPLFVDADAADWRLLAASPAIDAGDPAAPLDPDGTRADIGPFPFDHSLVGAPAVTSRGLALGPAVPNPASGGVTFAFTLAEPGRVRLAVHDLAGRRIAVLVDGELPGGAHRARWDGEHGEGGAAAPGVYFAVLSVDGASVSRKLVRMR